MAILSPSLHWRLIFSLQVLWWLIPNAVEATDFVFIADEQRVNENVHEITKCQGRSLQIGCGYRELIPAESITLTDVTNSVNLPLTKGDPVGLFSVRSYTLSESDSRGDRTYQCYAGVVYNVIVTIHFVDSKGACSDSPTTEEPTDTPSSDTPSTDTPATDTPTTGTDPTGDTSNSNPGGTTFKGLKPLIYTVASVILLGTLAIVSIVTCWIRARRSFQSRIMRPNNTPQDYLDYISDNEFTPLTTSEFMASLQERPPTYNQSEEMLQQSDTEGSSGEGDRTRDTESTTASTAGGGGGDRTPSGETRTSLNTDNEGATVERRRPREGSAGRERQRRRRRVVIVDSDDRHTDENSVMVTSMPGGVVITHDGGDDNVGDGALSRRQEPSRQHQNISQPTQSSDNISHGAGGGGGRNVTVLVNVQLPSLPAATTTASCGQSRNSPTPTQQEIEAIEARVNMLEELSSTLNNEHLATPNTSSTVEEHDKSTNDNLIDFSSIPSPPTWPTNSDLY